MPTVEFSDAAYEKLAFAAKIAGVSLTEAVDRVFGTSTQAAASDDPQPEPSASEQRQDEIKVTATYLGRRVTGYLDLDSERLRITEAPHSDLVRTFKSPSQAAVETVRHLNPGRKRPETNGWRFFCAEDGQLIERYRRR
ncbi:hypothetical protein ACN28C_25495 [Plantactinospora sp. WMMC1484]|uniref:hypothetical protein n=1 Tax=Plantactinospora sp. WMMC1484 TaxID=3404122 RepID=UPI003BF49FA6